MTKAGVFIYTITTIIAFIGFFAGITTDFFGLLAKPEYVPIGSCSIGILALLIGDRIASSITISSQNEHQRQKLEEYISSTPLLNLITEFRDCDTAMEYLTSRMPFAHTIWNTKISGDSIEPRDGSRYESALKQSIKLGLDYKDIVSAGFDEYANGLQKNAQGKKGTYSYKTLTDHPNSFINFVIIRDRNGDEELIFGWATSKNRGNEQSAFKVMDKRIISFFKEYHGDLFK